MYFCCLEALQNAAKHAPEASRADRGARDRRRGCAFSVTDDGPGFDVAAATAGHGYVNMSDRLGAIGGTVEWTLRSGRGRHDHRHHPTSVSDVPPLPDVDRAGSAHGPGRGHRPLGDPTAVARACC